MYCFSVAASISKFDYLYVLCLGLESKVHQIVSNLLWRQLLYFGCKIGSKIALKLAQSSKRERKSDTIHQEYALFLSLLCRIVVLGCVESLKMWGPRSWSVFVRKFLYSFVLVQDRLTESDFISLFEFICTTRKFILVIHTFYLNQWEIWGK